MKTEMNCEPYQIVYEFILSKEKIKRFHIFLDPKTISIMRPERRSLPDWTRLDHHQCKDCTLENKNVFRCPIAVNIIEIVETFKDMVSYDDCIVRCITPERIYQKNTSITEGLYSIFGVVMATSNCPIMDFFKPMARFHLPFSSPEETSFRVTSMFLLRRYFELGKDGQLNIDMAQLKQQYVKVKSVNEGLYNRIRSLGTKDADKNAIIMLHSLSEMFSSDIKYELDAIEYLFKPQNECNPAK
jgi:hypothetical protein